VATAIVRLPEADRELLKACETDLRAAGLIADLSIEPAQDFSVDVTLAPPEPAQEAGL
jgi:hypothetical protein